MQRLRRSPVPTTSGQLDLVSWFVGAGPHLTNYPTTSHLPTPREASRGLLM